MNGPEHYREAEQHIEIAKQRSENDLDAERVHLNYAAVHATLALAAAQAMPTVDKYMGDSAVTTEWGRTQGWATTVDVTTYSDAEPQQLDVAEAGPGDATGWLDGMEYARQRNLQNRGGAQ